MAEHSATFEASKRRSDEIRADLPLHPGAQRYYEEIGVI